jgi:hypothetical protein
MQVMADHSQGLRRLRQRPECRRLDVMREIRLRDQGAPSPGPLGRLRDLADCPARVICNGTADDVIRADEALRGMTRKFLREAA